MQTETIWTLAMVGIVALVGFIGDRIAGRRK